MKNNTLVFWINRHGESRRHALSKCTFHYALNWFRCNILECQGILSVDEKRNSKLKFLRVENQVEN